jgi:hypothetical protein
MTRAAEPTAHHLPFSRPIAVSEIPPDGMETTIRANDAERAALAEANNLVAIAGLEAEFRIDRQARESFKVAGVLRARVRQICVLSLQEFDQDIEAPIELRFAPAASETPPLPREAGARSSGRHTGVDGEIHHIVTLEDEEPDPIVRGIIDLGEVAAEFLTLNLDPYPRKPGASFAEPSPGRESASVSPFAKLGAALKKG